MKLSVQALEKNTLQQFAPHQKNIFIWLNMLVLLTGLLWFNWRPAVIVFAYVFETIIIGIIHVAKLWTVYKYGNTQKQMIQSGTGKLNGFGIIPFFIAHYFFFVLVQSVFIFSFMREALVGIGDNEFDILKHYHFLLSQTDMQLAFVCIGLSNIGYALRNFFIPQRYHDFTTSQLFIQPYIRIIVQQFLSILPGFFFFFFSGGGFVVAILLILLRTTLDLYLAALKNSPSLRQQLINKISQNGKLKNLTITDKQMDLFLE